MFKTMRHPTGPEFEARQMCLPIFGRAARIVLPIIVKLRKDLRAWEKPSRVVRKKVVNLLLALFCPINLETRP